MRDNTLKTPEQIEIYTNEIYIIVDNFIDQELKQDENILTNYGFFPRLLNHITNTYIKRLLNNDQGYNNKAYTDIPLLDKLFYIYIDLVYKYKLNKRPSMLEYSLFINIDMDTLYTWVNGENRYINNKYYGIVKKWFTLCEQALIDDKDTIKSIFLLKAKYKYRDNEPTQILLNSGNMALTADNLPKLGNNKSHSDIMQLDQNSTTTPKQA